jgi:hypothetical protein
MCRVVPLSVYTVFVLFLFYASLSCECIRFSALLPFTLPLENDPLKSHFYTAFLLLVCSDPQSWAPPFRLSVPVFAHTTYSTLLKMEVAGSSETFVTIY